MTWSEIAVVAVAAVALLLWWLWVAASRLDRLHRKVAASRAALDTQLVRRASAAAEISAAGLLDPVSSVLVGDAAWAALSAGGYGRVDLVLTVPDLAAELDDTPVGGAAGGEGLAGVPTGDVGGSRPEGRDPRAAPPGSDDRQRAESELSRTLRAAFGDELPPDDDAADELVAALAAAWYRVQLARRFHNEAVAQTQRVRRKHLVRALRLAGHAAVPRTVEIDDGWPDGLPRPGHVG